MHSNLSPHLHTTECNQLIVELEACHKNNKFQRFLGACNEIDSLLVKCLKKERLARIASNYKASLAKQTAIKNKPLENSNTN